MLQVYTTRGRSLFRLFVTHAQCQKTYIFELFMAKIFLIDDHPDVRNVYEELLQMHSHQVECYSSAIDIFQRIVETVPDVIIVDQNLPRISGIELLKSIREKKALSSVYVVIYSGDNRVQAQAIDGGAQEFWIKGSDDIFERIALLESEVNRHVKSA